jgi:lipopolysaccharide biosynthesis glycosyltransferase
MQIACATDARGVPHTAAMLHSVLSQNHGLDVEIALLHGPDLSGRRRDRLRRMVDRQGGAIEFVHVPDRRIEGLRPLAVAPPATWYRLLLPDLLPDLDRVLYLDTDTITLGSLAPLWEVELGAHHLAAVTNVLMREHEHRMELLGLPDRSTYFNVGVVVVNLTRWRQEGGSQAALDFVLQNPDKLGWGDQDTMNLLLPDRLSLHPKWNCTNAIMIFPWSSEVLDPEEVREARSSPVIRHFEGPTINKPWHLLCERPMRQVYFEHRRQTPWPRCRREGLTPANLATWLARRLR